MRSGSPSERSHLEALYLQLSRQIGDLLEAQARERGTLEDFTLILGEFSDGPHRPSQLLHQAESLLRLGSHTSAFRDQYRSLQHQLSEVAKQLGYW